MADKGEVRAEVISERSRVPLSRDEWNALCARNETNTVFQTYEWFDSWWAAFGADDDLFFVVVRRGEHILGFAPLMIRRVLPGMTQLQFTGTGNADYQDLVLPTDRPEGVAAICRLLRAHAHTWNRILFANIPVESSTPSLLEQCGADTGLLLEEGAHVRCPVLRLEGCEEAARQLIAKYSMRRPLNWFSRQGTVRFRHLTTLDEIAAMLPRFFDQHSRRCRAAGRRSLFDDARQREFYRLLARQGQGAHWLLFSVLELDDEPIAFHFGFDYRGDIIWYKPTFEQRYAERSPGLLLIRQLIEDALRRSRREVDFSIGDEQFKRRFANLERTNIDIKLYHSRFSYAIARVWGLARRRAGALLRAVRNPREAALGR